MWYNYNVRGDSMNIKVNIPFDLQIFDNWVINNIEELGSDIKILLKEFLNEEYHITIEQIDKKDYQKLLKKIKENY
jgi:hypothetical protein